MNYNYLKLTLIFILIQTFGFGQTTIFSEAGGGAEPSGWTFTNNVTVQPIDKGTYWLVEDGSPQDYITTNSYNLSTYGSATFTIDVATYGSGSANPAKIEISFDGGASFSQTEITNTPSSSSYISGGIFTLNSLSSQVVLRISSNGSSGRDVRLRNLELVATGTPSTAPTGVTTGTAGSITAASAIISGNDVSGDGGATITERGIVYGTSANPTTVDNKQVESGTTGTFNATLSGLNSSTTYYARAFATNSVGTTYGSDVSFTTNAPAGDTDSDIIENSSFTYTDNVDYTSYVNASPLTAANSLELAQFTILDGGSDGDADALTTTLTNLDLNVTNSANLNRIAIFDGTTNVAEVAAASSVSFSSLNLQAADNSSKDFSVRVSFQSTVTDNEQIGVTITTATAQAGASLFSSGDAGGAFSSTTGDRNKIEVTASQLAFIQQPSNTNVNAAIAPAVTVETIDANNNRDLDYTSTVNITSSGTLTGSPVGVTAVSGLATFNALTHTASGSSLELTASSGVLTGATSNSFDVIQIPTLLISEVADPSDVYQARFIELYNYGSSSIDLNSEAIYLVRQTNGGNLDNLQLTGTIQAFSFFVVVNDATNFQNEFGFTPDITIGGSAGNGDDGYFLYFNGDASTGTMLDAYGVLNVDGTGEAWEYTDSKAVRKNLNSTTPNTNWTASEWTITSASTTDMSPGTNENEFIYSGEWRPLPISNATTSDNIYIRSDYTTTTSFSTNNLTVDASRTLTIANTNALTTAGVITNNGTIVIENTGALVQQTGSTLAGSGTYEVQKTGFSGAVQQYNFWSSPVANGSINILGGHRYYYNPANATTNLSSGWTPASGNMEVGRGYIATNSGSVSFTGTVNNGDVSFSAFSATNGSAKVMNLIGNPYPSGLDLNAFIGNATNTSNLDGTFYFWDDDGSQGSTYSSNGYATWNPSGGGTWVAASSGGNKIANGAAQTVAASCQAFLVVPDASTSGAFNIEFTNSMRAENGATFFKANYTKTWLNIYRDTTWLSQAVVVNDSKATFLHDKLYDSPRVANSNSFIINTRIANKSYAINSIPDTSSRNLIVPIEISAPDSAVLTLKVNQIQSSSHFKTWLINEQENSMHLVDSALEVTVNVVPGNNNFLYLIYKPNHKITSVNQLDNNHELLTRTNQAIWFANNIPGTFMVFDARGKLIQKAGNTHSLNLMNLPKGLLLIQAEQNQHYETIKLINQ